MQAESPRLPHLHLIPDMGFADPFALRLKQLGLEDRNHIILVGKSPNKVKAKLPFPYSTLKDDNTPDPSDYDKVFIHFLLPMATHWLKKYPTVRFHWVFYGAEVYRNPLVGYNPYAPLTRKYLNGSFLNWMRIVGYHVLHRRAWKKALPKVASVLVHNPLEFDLIQKLVPIPQARHEPFTYGKAQLDSGSSKRSGPVQSGNSYKVQVGHCAFPSCNQLDFLSDAPASQQIEWHLPLSYGDENYAQWLQKKLSKREDIHFMMDLLPIEDYLQHIESLDAGVFPNIRQQGGANIQTFLLRGVPVFLHPDNPSFRYFMSKGVELGRTDRFSISEIDRLTGLADENRQAFIKDSGSDVCNERFARVFA